MNSDPTDISLCVGIGIGYKCIVLCTADVLIALQVVRTSSPGSRPRKLLPLSPLPGLVSKSPRRNSSTTSTEEFYFSFYSE